MEQTFCFFSGDHSHAGVLQVLLANAEYWTCGGYMMGTWYFSSIALCWKVRPPAEFRISWDSSTSTRLQPRGWCPTPFPFKPLHVWTIPTRGAGFGSNCQLSQAGNWALRCWIWIWWCFWFFLRDFCNEASPPCFSMQCYVSVLILETRSSFERALCTSELWQTRLDLLEDMKVLKTGQNIAVPHCSESRPWVLEPL